MPLSRLSWMSCAVTAAIKLCTESTKLAVGLQGDMSEPFSGRGEEWWSTPPLMYLPLNEQPDHLKNANDWQPEIYKLLIVLLKRMKNVWIIHARQRVCSSVLKWNSVSQATVYTFEVNKYSAGAAFIAIFYRSVVCLCVVGHFCLWLR